MTVQRSHVPLSDGEKLEGLSVKRILYTDVLRRCTKPGCGKILSRYNRHKDRCFQHQFSKAERDARNGLPTGQPSCGSRTTRGFDRVQLEYHGSLMGLS